MIVGGVKLMMLIFMGVLIVLLFGVVVVIVCVRIVYGVNSGVLVFVLIMFVSICGKFGFVYFFCWVGVGSLLILKVLLVICDRYGSL